MAIQQSINQGITGAMFLLSQSPMMEARRTKKARDAGLAAADKTVEEAKKEHEDATLATAGMPEDDDIMKVSDTSRERYIEKSKLAEGQRLRSWEDYADAVYGAYGQEEEYAKARQEALSRRGKMQGDYIADMQSPLQKKMVEETRRKKEEEETTRKNVEGFRSSINSKGVLEALREKERRSYNG